MRALHQTVFILLPLLLPACAGDKASDDPTTGGEVGEVTGPGDTSTSTTGDDEETDSTEDTTTTDDDSGGSFVNDGDIPETCGAMCDPWTPGDCPDNEKCTAVACEAGSTSWDSNVCRPIGGDGAEGDDCMGAGVDGNDDCGDGLLCWDANPDTGLGYCVALCQGSGPLDASCESSDALCSVYNGGVLPLCLPKCDPLAPDCPNADNLCIPHPDDEGFNCVLDASGDMGPYGTPCGFANSCNQGLVCIAAEAVPAAECTGSDACCSPICDITEPNSCPGADQGQQCEQFYEEGAVPPGYENVGVCAIPA